MCTARMQKCMYTLYMYIVHVIVNCNHMYKQNYLSHCLFYITMVECRSWSGKVIGDANFTLLLFPNIFIILSADMYTLEQSDVWGGYSQFHFQRAVPNLVWACTVEAYRCVLWLFMQTAYNVGLWYLKSSLNCGWFRTFLVPMEAFNHCLNEMVIFCGWTCVTSRHSTEAPVRGFFSEASWVK